MNNFKISMRACRVNADFTQDEISQMLGITRQQYRKWEKGIINLKDFQKISFSNIVGIPIENIFFKSSTCKMQVNKEESSDVIK